jgi:hypothetical protein
MQRELTMKDVLTDPLIALLRRADGISTPEFTRLLSAASETYAAGKTVRSQAPHRGGHAASLPRDDQFEANLSRDLSSVRGAPTASQTCLCS